VITERRVEKGDLISVGSPDKGRLFSIAQGRVLRIQVSVPQFYAIDLKPGQQAEVNVRERPGERFTGKVARTAQSISADSRTLLTEVQVENASGRLLPGMYAEVKFVLPRSKPVAIVPGSALVADASGTRLVVVTRDRRVHFVKVEQGRDLGAELEIVSGLAGDEEIANNPPDNLSEGQQVSVVTAAGGPAREKQ
jgi:RND family efflux transporter MFP subunit